MVIFGYIWPIVRGMMLAIWLVVDRDTRVLYSTCCSNLRLRHALRAVPLTNRMTNALDCPFLHFATERMRSTSAKALSNCSGLGQRNTTQCFL